MYIFRWQLVFILLLSFSLIACDSVAHRASRPGVGLFHSDFWSDVRHRFALKSVAHKSVGVAVHDYATHRIHLTQNMTRAAPYLYHVHQALTARAMPGELLLLPFVESDYHPFAYSLAGATGLWQMMPGTAMGYGVPIDWWYDGRRDLVLATDAALRYLGHLHRLFPSDWLLAVAAYDAGEGRVQRALSENRKRGLPLDFNHLPLPQETKHYIARFLALKALVSNPGHYHVTLPFVLNAPHFVSVEVSRQITLAQVAAMADMSLSDLRALNPGYRRLSTGPAGPHDFLLPMAHADRFKERLLDWQSGLVDEALWIKHEVVSGDTLSALAVRYHSRVALIQRINQLKTARLKPGQRLLIIQSESQGHVPKRTQRQIAEDGFPGPHMMVYYVKPGDTLSVIAKHYGLTHDKIMFWNQLTKPKALRAGDRLVLWLQQKRSSPYYIVHAGDCLGVLAKRYDVGVDWLKKRNHLVRNTIRAGQKLIVR